MSCRSKLNLIHTASVVGVEPSVISRAMGARMITTIKPTVAWASCRWPYRLPGGDLSEQPPL